MLAKVNKKLKSYESLRIKKVKLCSYDGYRTNLSIMNEILRFFVNFAPNSMSQWIYYGKKNTKITN